MPYFFETLPITTLDFNYMMSIYIELGDKLINDNIPLSVDIYKQIMENSNA